jgi:flagellar biosynthesis protein FlhF
VKIKRYLDKDMRHVLRRVREDQGPDAVILSNRRVDEGIEVIAAIDYDEALVRHAIGDRITAEQPIDGDVLAGLAQDDTQSAPELPAARIVSADLLSRPAENDVSLSNMQDEISSLRGLLETQLGNLVWKDQSERYPLRAQMLRNLSQLGVAPDIANIVIDRLPPEHDVRNTWNAPLSTLAQMLPVQDSEILTKGGTIALIGPTGVGKTTTIAKIAAHYAMNNWANDIALVSADSFRIGAKEHLQAFANIIGCDVHPASSYEELTDTLERLQNKKLVLIDTEGRSQRDRDLASNLAAYGQAHDRVRFYLTLSAATQESALDEIVREFNRVPLDGCVVTKIDEAGQLGCVMSALIRHDVPAAWFSDGQRVPEDLHAASRKKLWLVNEAVACMESSQPRIDERIMAESFSTVSAAHA